MPWKGLLVGAAAGGGALLSDSAIAPRIAQSTWAKMGIDLLVAGLIGLIAAYALHKA